MLSAVLPCLPSSTSLLGLAESTLGLLAPTCTASIWVVVLLPCSSGYFTQWLGVSAKVEMSLLQTVRLYSTVSSIC